MGRSFHRRLRAVKGFADLPTDEPPDEDVLAEFGDGRRYQVLDRLVLVADVALIQQADGLVELVELALDDLGDGLRRLVLHLLGGNFLLLGSNVKDTPAP